MYFFKYYSLTKFQTWSINMNRTMVIMQNLSPEANIADIRTYFGGLSIPDGGILIEGGQKNEAFVTFRYIPKCTLPVYVTDKTVYRVLFLISTLEDARQAMLCWKGGRVKGVTVKLLTYLQCQNRNAYRRAQEMMRLAQVQQHRKPRDQYPIFSVNITRVEGDDNNNGTYCETVHSGGRSGSNADRSGEEGTFTNGRQRDDGGNNTLSGHVDANRSCGSWPPFVKTADGVGGDGGTAVVRDPRHRINRRPSTGRQVYAVRNTTARANTAGRPRFQTPNVFAPPANPCRRQPRKRPAPAEDGRVYLKFQAPAKYLKIDRLRATVTEKDVFDRFKDGYGVRRVSLYHQNCEFNCAVLEFIGSAEAEMAISINRCVPLGSSLVPVLRCTEAENAELQASEINRQRWGQNAGNCGTGANYNGNNQYNRFPRPPVFEPFPAPAAAIHPVHMRPIHSLPPGCRLVCSVYADHQNCRPDWRNRDLARPSPGHTLLCHEKPQFEETWSHQQKRLCGSYVWDRQETTHTHY